MNQEKMNNILLVFGSVVVREVMELATTIRLTDLHETFLKMFMYKHAECLETLFNIEYE
jgi:hypothetical protein